MLTPAFDNVVAHWHKLIDGLSTTSLGFYGSVEEALQRRAIPGLKSSRITWNEGGVLSPRREYLRVMGDRHVFDLCAAPFGTGFFFSSWLTRRKARFVFLYLFSVAFWVWALSGILWGLINASWQGSGGLIGGLIRSGVTTPVVLLPASSLIVLWLVAVVASAGHVGHELAILTVPILGWFYQRVFAPETYYRTDTMLMFQSAVHSAMLEAVDELTRTKGVRGLTEDERKPVFRQLV